jgi:hypothetical protein
MASTPPAAPASSCPRRLPRPYRDSVAGAAGDYRTGDEIWCERIPADAPPKAIAAALNRDVLLPRPLPLPVRAADRHDGDKLHVLPLGAGQRQAVVTNPPWVAVAVKLVRSL